MNVFEEVRAGVSISQAITYLGLKATETKGDQLRFRCPKCGGENRDLSVNLHKGFQCFAGHKKGDDATALVAHVKGIRNGEAAQLLKEHFLSSASATKPTAQAEGKGRPESANAPRPLELLGIDAPLAKHLRIREDDGLVLFDLRDAQGIIRGTLAIATRDDLPLVEWVGQEEVKADEPKADGLVGLWRIVKGGAA